MSRAKFSIFIISFFFVFGRNLKIADKTYLPRWSQAWMAYGLASYGGSAIEPRIS